MPFDSAGYLQQVYADCIRGEEDLHDYQREAVNWLYDRPFSALFIDTGMGKTVIIETLLDRLFLEGYRGKVLIIAPIRVLNRVWMREHLLWRHLAYLNPNSLRVDDADPRLNGDKISRGFQKLSLRNKAIEDERQVHLINQEAVPWLIDKYIEKKANGKLREVKLWPYSVMIFDESSRLRDHNAEVCVALRRVRQHRIKRFHQLTATPASQTYMHLFSQIYLLDQGERLGNTKGTFQKKYFDHNEYTRTWTIREGAAEEIEKKIADICLVMRRIKNFVVNTRSIALPPNIMREYREFERESVLELPDGAVIDAVNGAALSNKLLQYASGAVYDPDGKYYIIHDEKIEELNQLCEETLDNPLLVAYWYKSSLDRLKKAFPKALVMDREGKAEGEWNKGKHKLMFLHPRGSAHGLNLQFGGHHIAMFDIFWPLELFTQIIDRLDRPPQQHTVMVHLLSAAGTMDEVVSANLEHLRSAENAMFRRLRQIQQRKNNVREPDQLCEL